MPRKTTAHAELDGLRQDVARERVKARDVDAELESAKLRLEDIGDALTELYIEDDVKRVQQLRQELQAAEGEVKDLAHRSEAGGLRVERAQQQLDEFMRTHAVDLLTERESNARTVAAELTASVHHTLKLAKAYVAERQTQDQLIAAIPEASPRVDGAAATHPWEQALKNLERAYHQTPELEPPLPRWAGLAERERRDRTHRLLQLRRRKQLTDEEQQELGRINHTHTEVA